MKQYLSVLKLAVRGTIYKILGLVAVMGGAEYYFFAKTLRSSAHTWSAYPQQFFTLEEVVTLSRMPLICGGTFLILCVVLCLNGCELRGSRLSYTLRRLSISEKNIQLLWAAYYFACFTLLWLAQLVIAFVLGNFYMASPFGDASGNQTLFLAFYRSGFLHSLMPLAEVSRLVRNLICCLCLSLCASAFSLRQRRGRRAVAMIPLAAMVVVCFSMPMGRFSGDLTLSVFFILVAAFALNNVAGDDGHE